MKRQKAKNKPFRTLMKYALKYWYLLLLVIITAGVEVYVSLDTVMLIGDGIDKMVGGGVDFKELAEICVNIAIHVGIYIVAEWTMEVLASVVTHKVIRNIRRDVFVRIQEVPLAFIDGNRTGELLSRMVVDVEQISDGLLLAFTQLFSGLMTIIATIIIMMLINYKIGLIIVCVTPLSLILATFISKGTHKYFKKQSEIRGDITSLTEEAVGSGVLYKTFGYEERGAEKFEKTNKALEKCSIKGVFFSSMPNPTTRFINNVIYILIGLVGSLSIIAGGGITVGKLVSFLTYALKYAKPFNEITDVITEIESAVASAERVFEISKAQPEQPDGENAVILGEADGNVNLKDVCFSYDKSVKLIENFNLDVSSGQNIAIVGRTGCGKTTLINILMRFYDIDSGEIKVSGHKIEEITRDSLRSSYGMVLQDSYIFSGTIRHNIAFGRDDATDEEITEAAKRAHAYGFIKRLPDGLETVIGENSNLSEGQKQLLCIARAMLDLPNMLILDEATSSVDTRTEIKIQRAFDEMMETRTCFVVAHRLSTIKKADRIIVMDKGKIIEQGSHEELLKKGGFYAELYNSQFAR